VKSEDSFTLQDLEAMKAIQKAKPEAVENQLLKSDDGVDLDAAVV